MENDLTIQITLTTNQHGFLRGKSTDSAIHTLTRKIEDAITSKGYALGIFIDIEGAFDNLPFATITASLRRANLPNCIELWLTHLTSNRTISLSFNSTTVTRRVGKGTAQVGVTSPII